MTTKKSRRRKTRPSTVKGLITLSLLLILIITSTIINFNHKLISPRATSYTTLTKPEAYTIFSDSVISTSDYKALQAKYISNLQKEMEIDTYEPGVIGLIEKYFPDDTITALKVAKAESGLRANAQGWNCYYNGKSGACKKEDRGNAWSTDCGIFQISVKGKVCPQELLDPETNIRRAKQMYESRGWTPWVAYNKGLHINLL